MTTCKCNVKCLLQLFNQVYFFLNVCFIALMDFHTLQQVELTCLAKKKAMSVRDLRFPGLPLHRHQVELKLSDGKHSCYGFSSSSQLLLIISIHHCCRAAEGQLGVPTQQQTILVPPKGFRGQKKTSHPETNINCGASGELL